jgi:hypothetical protein
VGRHCYETPFVVRAKRHRGRVLVVLPAISWQARNPVDGDGDGFPDLLPDEHRVGLDRPFAGDGLPEGFRAGEAHVLLALQKAGARFDLTTDLALTRGSSPPLARYRGVLFAAAPRFFSIEAGRLVRSFLDVGGRVAWLGTAGFTAPVRVAASTVELVADRPGRNFLGERLRQPPHPGMLTVLGDRIDFFRGIGASFGPFPGLEDTVGLPSGARPLASAGSEADRPALTVYRQRSGIVARVGVDGFARAAARSPDVERIMRRLWILLSR